MSGLTPRGAHSSCAGHGDLVDQEIPRLVDSLVNRCVQHVSCGWYHTTVVVGMDPNISLLRYRTTAALSRKSVKTSPCSHSYDQG
jgi:hypothetical protein